MDNLSLFARAFQYPTQGQIAKLFVDTQSMEKKPGSKEFTKFVKELNQLSLSEQEELYTKTLDLSPLSAPYVGYHTWGESYKRGEFMAALNKEMKELKIDLEGELPDHRLPILRYLHATPTPLPDLTENLEKSLKSMIESLKKGEKDNPYLYLYEALMLNFAAVKVEE